jgi:hypothetical protein
MQPATFVRFMNKRERACQMTSKNVCKQQLQFAIATLEWNCCVMELCIAEKCTATDRSMNKMKVTITSDLRSSQAKNIVFFPYIIIFSIIIE